MVGKITGNRGTVSGDQSMGMGSVGTVDFQKFLTDVNFPIDKNGLIQAIKRNHAPEDVLTLVNRLPDRKFQDINELTRELTQIKRV